MNWKNKYRMYIDEVGNPDLASSDNPNHRFLSLTGIIIELEYVRSTVSRELEGLKAKFFRSHPDEPVIMHRKEILNCRPPFNVLSNLETREKFNQELLALLEKWKYIVISVCIDKKRHKETYSTWRYDPYHYCLAILVERFVLFLERIDAGGDLIAESRGGKEDLRLKESFRRLWESGTNYITRDRIQAVITSKELKVKPKANNIAGLQLADIIAHPSRNEILAEHSIKANFSPFASRIIELLKDKYDRIGSRIEGIGKKFL